MNLDLKSKLPTVTYIVGRGHSGSTMLELLLNRNPEIAAMGEVNLLGLQLYRNGQARWIGECSCKKRPHTCPEWGATLRSIEKKYSIDLNSAPLSFRVSDEGLAEEYGWTKPFEMFRFTARRQFRRLQYSKIPVLSPISANYHKGWSERRDFLYNSYATSRKTKIVVDASKDYLQMQDLVRHSKCKVKVLYITRDVRGHAWSAIRKRNSTAELEAKTWSRLNERILKSLESIEQSQWLHVKYEHLCSKTEQTLSNIFDFVGASDKKLAPEQEKAKRHTIAGNRTRFRDLSEIREDNKWKENLSISDLSMIKKHASKISERLGYKL